MKISVITGGYPAPGRPVNVFVEQLVDEMINQGVHVDVIAPQSITRFLFRHEPLLPKVSTKTIGDKYYNIYRPYFISLGRCPQLVLKILEAIRYRGIKKILKKVNPDVLYGHFWNNGYVVKDYALKKKIPVFVACGEGDSAIEDLLARMTEKQKCDLVKAVKGVISVSSENKRICVECGLSTDANTGVFPNAINPGLFYVKKNKSELRANLNLSDDDFVIAFVGSLIHRKGAQRLSDAIKKLNNPHIKVFFIGKEQAGASTIPDCGGILFMGSLNHDEIPDYLMSSDIFCLPTLKEGCCNAIVEALAVGLPVVSSDCSFNYDILDETNSIMVNPMDVDAIATAINTLYTDKQKRKELSNGAIEKTKLMTIQNRARKIIEFISSKKGL